MAPSIRSADKRQYLNILQTLVGNLIAELRLSPQSSTAG